MKQLLPSDSVAFLSQFHTFVFDCDGVLWRGSEAIPGARELIELLRSLNKTIIFVTNNSTSSRKQYCKKFEKLSMTVFEKEIFGSSYAAAVYLVENKFQGKAYVVGGQGIIDELELANIPFSSFTHEEKEGEIIEAVVVGLDVNFSYERIARAQKYLFNPNCQLIATNDDATYPAADRMMPGAGVMVAAMEKVSGKKAVVLGKPHPTLLQCLQAAYDLEPQRTLMIGDRLETDILFGKNGGFQTLLVLSGVATLEDVEKAPDNHKPDYWAPSVGTISLGKNETIA